MTNNPGDSAEKKPWLESYGWVAVKRGFGEFILSDLNSDECVTASGLHDGGWIVWRRAALQKAEGR